MVSTYLLLYYIYMWCLKCAKQSSVVSSPASTSTKQVPLHFKAHFFFILCIFYFCFFSLFLPPPYFWAWSSACRFPHPSPFRASFSRYSEFSSLSFFQSSSRFTRLIKFPQGVRCRLHTKLFLTVKNFSFSPQVSQTAFFQTQNREIRTWGHWNLSTYRVMHFFNVDIKKIFRVKKKLKEKK